MKRARSPFADLYAAAFGLAAEANTVIGLRVLKAIRGDPEWPAEARLMVEEKTRAAYDAQALMLASLWTGTTATAPSRTLALYHRRVKANRRRLSRPR